MSFDESTKLFEMIRRRRTLALTVFVAVFGLGALLSFILPTKYTSSMQILVRATPTDLRAMPERADAVQIGQVSEEQVNSELSLLTNYDLLREAVVKNHLYSDGGDSAAEQKHVDQATRKLGQKLVVSAVRKANIIEVQYSANSPQLAASVLRTIQAGYLNAHLRAQSTPGGYLFFQREMVYDKNKLVDKQHAFAEFNSKQGAANLDQQLTLLTRTISDQETALQQAQAQVAELQTEIGQSTNIVKGLSSRVDTIRKGVPNLSAIDHLTTLLADLEDRRTQQSSKFRDDDPVVRQTDNEIAVVKRELEDARSLIAYEVSTDVNPISQNIESSMTSRKVELAGLESKVDVLKAQIAANRSRVNHLTDASGQYHLLSSDVENAQDDYNNYSQRQENARVSESLDKNKISNVVWAQEPTESVQPVSSHRLLILAFSFFFAVFASIASCVYAEIRKSPRVLNPA